VSDDKEIFVFSNNEAAARFAVNKWVEISAKSVADKGYFTAAISGGRTPIDFYKRLSYCKGPLPWEKTHIFLADERFVQLSDKESNYHLIQEYLLNYINIPEENVHPIQTEEDTLEQSAKKYEEDMRGFFDIWKDGIPAFDLIMLGLGEDGHTASLFPGSSSLTVTDRLAIPVTTDRVPPQRISLTLTVLNNAAHIIFLVTGAKKAGVLKEILEHRKSTLPAALVRHGSRSVYFVMDEGAASLLTVTRT
jgi:6-phosphogluconolactonase